MDWELRHVEDTEAVLDDSGVYVLIARVSTVETHKEHVGIRVMVRADLMATDVKGDKPIMSFSGSANAVRKALIRFLLDDAVHIPVMISREHAAYIGYELLRAELTPNYQQD